MRLDRVKDLAKKVSLTSDHHSHKIGAVITKGKAVLAARSNWLFKTHPVYNKINELKTLHAEASAILSARHKNDLQGATIIVYRDLKNGSLANARPCDDCQKLMRAYGIKKMIYTKDNIWMEEKL